MNKKKEILLSEIDGIVANANELEVNLRYMAKGKIHEDTIREKTEAAIGWRIEEYLTEEFL